jgi:hypothetical protein
MSPDIAVVVRQSIPRVLSKTHTTGELHFKLYLPDQCMASKTVGNGSSFVPKSPCKTLRPNACPGNAYTQARVMCRQWSPRSNHAWPPVNPESETPSMSLQCYRNGGWLTSPGQSLEEARDAHEASLTETAVCSGNLKPSLQRDCSARPPNQMMGSRAPSHWGRKVQRPKILMAAETAPKIKPLAALPKSYTFTKSTP